MKKIKIAVIGSGVSGIAAATTLAAEGHEVHVYEKNADLGGRLRKFSANGYTFDMGPSWYWMPDVFENYYQRFGYTSSDFYELERLNPSYQVVFSEETIKVPAELDKMLALYEERAKGSAERLLKFLKDARYKYEQGMTEFVWKPALSWREYLHIDIMRAGINMNMLNSVSSEVYQVTNDPSLRQILEFPVLFLGAKPEDTPGMYTLMNYADIELGTWYPQGGMSKIVDAFVTIAENQGVIFHRNSPVNKIEVIDKMASIIHHNDNQTTQVDAVIAGADYHHVDQELLEPGYRNYSEKYWNKRTMSPSSLLYYIGVDREMPELLHHTLFFDTDFKKHAYEIYDEPQYPEEPLFYVCNPASTDNSVAPEGHSSLFILMPLAAGLEDSSSERSTQFANIKKRLNKHLNYDITPHIKYFRSYAMNDFVEDYNSYKGNAYGLANTLRQTAFMKPSMKNKKVKNLYYAGQLTNPGPGLPPSIISGQIAADLLLKEMK